jgi:hypothetical protein
MMKICAHLKCTIDSGRLNWYKSREATLQSNNPFKVMKKLILSATMMTGLSLVANAQQVVFADLGSYSYDTEINGVPNITQDLNLELLVYNDIVTVPVVTLLLSQTTTTVTSALGTIQPAKGDITQGYSIYDLSNNEYNVGNAGLAGNLDYQVLAWTGNYSTFTAASTSGDALIGRSPFIPFYALVEAGLPPVGIDLESNPINLIPEPSSLAMATVASGLMLVFGCRKFVKPT